MGLDEAALEALATAPEGSVRKAARPSLAIALAEGGWAATTVSATMIVASAAGITTFATGGIGGVHRGALDATGGTPASLDISSDLEELGRTAMAVVCAGPKAILDVPATLEYLETRGVPVISIGQDEVPGFFARSSGIKAPAVARDEDHAARIVAAHLALGLGSGALVCVPVPPDVALRDDVARDAVQQAIADAEDAGIAGPAVTPWLLARIAEITEWSIGAREHRLDREQRALRRPPRGRAPRRLLIGQGTPSATLLILPSQRGLGTLAGLGGRPRGRCCAKVARAARPSPPGPGEDGAACASMRAVRARTSRKSSARSARSSTSGA